MMLAPSRASAPPGRDPAVDPFGVGPSPPPVPSRAGVSWLVFEFAVLLEYWFVPSLFAGWNYTPTWDAIGYVLFAALWATLGLSVLSPLRRVLSPRLAATGARRRFGAVAVTGVAVGLLLTQTVRLDPGAAIAQAPVPGLAGAWVNTPFGMWPGATFWWPQTGVFVALDPVLVSTLAVLSVLSAAAVTIASASVSGRCEPTGPPARHWRPRLLATAAWLPVGFISGCSYCAPAFLAGLGAVAPGAVGAAYGALPIDAATGLAGSLYLASLAIALVVLRRSIAGSSIRPRSPAAAGAA